jgi:hypothetical protein
MSEGKSWYETGYGGVNREQDRMDNYTSGPNRLWLPPKGERDIVFVDDEAFCIHEHNPKMNGSWRNWMTCLKPVMDNPPCCAKMGEKSAYYIGFYTIIDCSEYIDKNGNKHQYEVKLLGAKLKTLQKLRRKREQKGALAGTMWHVVREDQKSPSVGDEFEFVRPVDMGKLITLANFKGKKLTELFDKAKANPDNLTRMRRTFQLAVDPAGVVIPKIVPFNYMEILKPMDAKAMKDIMDNAHLEEDGKPGAEVDGVPF